MKFSTGPISLQDALTVSKAAIRGQFEAQLKRDIEMLQAVGMDEDEIGALAESARARFEESLPAMIEGLKRRVVDAFAH